MDRGENAAGIAVKAVLCAVVADLANSLSCNVGNIYVCTCCDLAHYVDKTGGNKGLAGNACVGVLGDYGIEDGIGYFIGDLVGMAFCY